MALVGYLRKTKTGVEGEPGSMYNYVLAANGVFIQAENEHLWAMLPVEGLCLPPDQPGPVRGLITIEPRLMFKHGGVPGALWEEVSGLLGTVEAEVYVAVVWEEGKYRAVLPPQVGKAATVKYARVPGAIIEVHSHPKEMLFFSATDDDDELGFQVYGVAAKAWNLTPEGMLVPYLASIWRVSIYGHYHMLKNRDDVFQGR